MKNFKNILENHHTTQFNATHREIFSTINKLVEGEYIKIEYTTLPKELSPYRTMASIMDDITNGHKGEHKNVYYKRGEGELRNASGYMLFQDDTDDWKSVDIRNTISVTNMKGIKVTRLGQ